MRVARDQEATNLFSDLVVQFGTATELSLREYVARALLNKALAFKALAKKKEKKKQQQEEEERAQEERWQSYIDSRL
jgi:DNA topoisomerase IB